REGSDKGRQGGRLKGMISIHAPREGSDLQGEIDETTAALFLSTLPARGATSTSKNLCFSLLFLSTLPARGATPTNGHDTGLIQNFYPRSPRGERLFRESLKVLHEVFLSTLPARGATFTACSYSLVSR